MSKQVDSSELVHEPISTFPDKKEVLEIVKLETHKESPCSISGEKERRKVSLTPESGSAELNNTPLEVSNKRKRPKVGLINFLSNKNFLTFYVVNFN